MIQRSEIEAKGTEFGINVANVERDYVFGWLLTAIFTQTALRDILILKGGNAFRKTYFENTRFSADLDFSTQQAIDQELLTRELNRACQIAQELSGVRFKCNTRVGPPLLAVFFVIFTPVYVKFDTSRYRFTNC